MALPPSISNEEAAAKRRAAQEDVFLREVDDALRQDEMEGFFRKFGKPLLAIVVLGLAGFGGYLYWEHRQKSEAEAQAELVVQALDDMDSSNLEAASKKLGPIARDGNIPARLLEAGIAQQKGDMDAAAKLYAQVAADESVSQPLRDLATVREIAASFEKLPPQTVIDRLKPLAAPGGAWFGVAGEMVAMAYLKQGKPDLAGPVFAGIAKDESLPESLRGRARQLAGLLGVDAVEDVISDKTTANDQAEGGE